MRVFLTACLAIVILAVGGYFAVNAMQRPSTYAFTTEGARINPSWSMRKFFTGAKAPSGRDGMAIPAADRALAEECDVGTTWRWILVDFSESTHDVPECN